MLDITIMRLELDAFYFFSAVLVQANKALI